MLNTESYIESYLNEYEKHFDQLSGHHLPWLKQKREQAFEQFKILGFPTVKNEAWKYTNVTPIIKKHFTFTPQKKSSIKFERFNSYLFNDTLPRLVFINGYYAKEFSHHDFANDIIVSNLADALNNYSEIIKSNLDNNSQIIPHGFAKLNTAFMDDGAFIYIPKKMAIAEPIYLLFITNNDQENSMSHIRNLIVAEEGSTANVIEHYLCLDEISYFNNVITEIYLHPNASLTHTKLQQEGLKGFHIGTTQVTQTRASHFTSHVFGFGASLARSDTNVELNGDGACCSLNGLYYARQRQHMDFHTRIEHTRQHGSSREYYKGIATDFARAVFNGKVIVHPQAQKTDAMQNNKNLLLSKHAEIDAKPELEIYADDVKCSHGATVGQLDEEELFYLRSRGIDLPSAIHLILFAFAFEIIDKVKEQAIRDKILSLFIRQLSLDIPQELLRLK